MSTVKSTWRTYGRITLYIGAPLFAAAVACFAFWLVTGALGLAICALVLGINGAVWLALCIAFTLHATREANKLQRLKGEGLRYDAHIVRVVHDTRWMRMGSYVSAHLECGYQNQEGKQCLVKSDSFLAEELFAGYAAVVYVNRNDPADYAVELSVGGQADADFDLDYR